MVDLTLNNQALLLLPLFYIGLITLGSSFVIRDGIRPPTI